jgi:2-oxoisovalerate dehydrogenase E1 component
MPKLVPLRTETPWLRIQSTEADWKKEKPPELARLLEQLFVIRRFEEKLLELKGEDLVHGPVHSSIGQEGGAVGAISALRRRDRINGSHRMHHQFLAKVLNYAITDGYDPRKEPCTEAMHEVVSRTMAEIMGLTPGYAGGRGGSMHLRHVEAGVMGASAIVAGSMPHACGYAFADKMRGRDIISMTFVGDGGMMNGVSYEALNLAALFDLPVIFFVENNAFAVSTAILEQTREPRLSSRGRAFAVPSLEVDGNDVLAVRKAVHWGYDHIRRDRGPVLIEALTFRHLHHSGPLKGSAFGYRGKEDEEDWLRRDPIVRFRNRLVALRVVDDSGAEELDRRARAVVDAAAGALTESEPDSNRRRVVPSLWPDPRTVNVGIRGDLSELAGVRTREIEDCAPTQLKEVKYVEAVAQVMLRNMERLDEVVVIGEDVHRMRGGHSGATKGIDQRFPERLIGTPISEAGFVGLALGACLAGLRPVVELMYPDFCWVAADQLFNQVGKIRHMYGGNFPVPIVVRSRVAPADGYGSQHSMDPSGAFALFPGWRIVAPSTPFDYIGLMNSAIRCDDPVLVAEAGDLYDSVGPIHIDDLDYVIPLGSAKVVRPGSACTVLAYLSMVRICLQAAEQTGIDAEVIDLRTVDPLGLDWKTIEASVRRTNRAMIVEQRARGTSLGARIVQELQARCFDWLDNEVLHVCGTDAPPVVSKVMERAAVAGYDDVVAGLRRLVGAGR